MGKRPSFQFYPGDWMKDPALSMCEPATRGIWVDLLCAIHELDHAGQVTGTPEQLSRLCRCSVAQFVDALTEIRLTRSADVSERNGIVTVTSRRMKRDSIEREKINERVKKHRCNGVVTDVETQMKQRSSSSSSSSLQKEQQAAPKSAPLSTSFEKTRSKPTWQPVPSEIEELIVSLVKSRRKLGQPVRSDYALSASLRQVYRDNPGEVDNWRNELEENENTISERENVRKEQIDRANDKAAEEAGMDAEKQRSQAILKRFESLPFATRNDVLKRAKAAADCDGGPDTPWLYVREIEQIFLAEGVSK